MASACRDDHEFPDGSSIVQDYLKVVHEIGRQKTGRLARTGEVAKRLGVSPSTVTCMFRRLESAGLLAYEAYRGARPTVRGEHLAAQVLRRHQVLEEFLAQVLELIEQDVHEDAERLEHCVSNEVVSRMETFLKRREAAA